MGQFKEQEDITTQNNNRNMNKFMQEQEQVELKKIQRKRGITRRNTFKILNDQKATSRKNSMRATTLTKQPSLPNLGKEKRNLSSKKKLSKQSKSEFMDKPKINLLNDKGEKIFFKDVNYEDQDEVLIYDKVVSQEIQELMNDYKFYPLHQHLFDGSDDIWLTKLDEVFDSSALDWELFGREAPSHFQLVSIFGGLIPLPLYIIISYLSGETLTGGFFEIWNKGDSYNFYEEMFASNWQNAIITATITFLYTVKPFSSTNFILSSQSTLSYIALEILTKSFFTLVTMIFILEKGRFSTMEGFGFFLTLFAYLLYYTCSDLDKKSREVKSACEAVKTNFQYRSLHQIQDLNIKLQRLQGLFGPKDAYRILTDVLLSQNLDQLDYSGSGSLQLQKLFDQNHQTNTKFHGGSYPRPSLEIFTKSYVELDNDDFINIDAAFIMKMKQDGVFNLNTYSEAHKMWVKKGNVVSINDGQKISRNLPAQEIDDSYNFLHYQMSDPYQKNQSPNSPQSPQNRRKSNASDENQGSMPTQVKLLNDQDRMYQKRSNESLNNFVSQSERRLDELGLKETYENTANLRLPYVNNNEEESFQDNLIRQGESLWKQDSSKDQINGSRDMILNRNNIQENEEIINNPSSSQSSVQLGTEFVFKKRVGGKKKKKKSKKKAFSFYENND